MKKLIIFLAIISMATFVRASCNLIKVTNSSSCTVFVKFLTHTTCTTNICATTYFQLLPGATKFVCAGDPLITWSPNTANVTDIFNSVRIETNPSLAPGCPVASMFVGNPNCGLSTFASMSPSQNAGCPFSNCIALSATAIYNAAATTWTITIT
jgi:hypothetical protein